MMNERIEKLAIQAANGMLSFNAEGEWRLSEREVEKFAELIVRECAGVELYWLNEQDRKAVAEKIKQHFGVE
jgi:hypothetical protein